MDAGTFNVSLDTEDGRRVVNVMTRQGAHSFLEAQMLVIDPDRPSFLVANLETAGSLRAQLDSIELSGDIKAQAEQQLHYIYSIFRYVAAIADPFVFDMAFKPRPPSPSKELPLYWKHVESVLKTLSEDSQWRTTGQVKAHDKRLLDSVTTLCGHLIACQILLDQTTILKTMATFLGNCKNPSGEVCEEFLWTFQILKSTMTEGMNKSLVAIYRLYERTGVLGQAMRCFAYPAKEGRPGFLDELTQFLDDLMHAPRIVQKKLKPGTPTGDILVTLLERKDIKTSIHNRLQSLSHLSRTYESDGRAVCSRCNKSDPCKEFQTSLKLCQRCKGAYYCNRECQIAHWKVHKKVCKPYDKKAEPSIKAARDCVRLFASDNYFQIMITMADEVDAGKYQKEDALLVLDFVPDTNGVAPALEDPPNFSFVNIAKVLSGGDGEPDWFHDEDAQQWFDDLEQASEECAANELLIACRMATGKTMIPVQGQATETFAEMHSNETLQAFTLALDGDYSGLSSHFGKTKLTDYLQQSCVNIVPLLNAMRRMNM